MAYPNLFLIGAAKAGSSTLAFQLKSHPDIGMAAKEPNIFNQSDLTACRARLESFARTKLPQRWVLDASVNYSQYPKFEHVPYHIAALTEPGAVRFAYMMRNPIDRAISQYFWRRERFGENRPLEEAMAADSVYVMSSRYDIQIRKYLEHFSADQFYFVKHESYYQDVAAAYAALCRWLGITDTHAPDVEMNRGATQKDTTKDARFPLINQMYRNSATLRKMVTALPQDIQSKLSGSMSKTIKREPVTSEQRRFILDRLGDSIPETENLTGFDLSDWADIAS